MAPFILQNQFRFVIRVKLTCAPFELSIQDVASSLGMNNLPEELLQRLAKDVEYRIYQVVEVFHHFHPIFKWAKQTSQEAARFTRHGKRTTMSTQDIEQAFQVMNIEPLYGHLSHMNSTFRRTVPNPANTGSKSTVPVFFVEDEEIDFDKVLRDERVTLPKAVSWHAHWLAVEGIQPLTADNPPKPPLSGTYDSHRSPCIFLTVFHRTKRSKAIPTSLSSRTCCTSRPDWQTFQTSQTCPIQRTTNLLQSAYCGLITSFQRAGTKNSRARESPSRRRTSESTPLSCSLGWPKCCHRYSKLGDLVRLWANSRDSPPSHPRSDSKRAAIYRTLCEFSLYSNFLSTTYPKEQLHQILPPLLSILLTSSLPPEPATLRRDASEILAYLSLQHGTTYPSLSERLTKTLLLALLSPDKTSGSREGAVRGLASLSPQAIERGLIESGGARVIGDDAVSDQDGEVLAVMV